MSKKNIRNVIDDLCNKFVNHQQRKAEQNRINKSFYYGTTLKNKCYSVNPESYNTRRQNELYKLSKYQRVI